MIAPSPKDVSGLLAEEEVLSLSTDLSRGFPKHLGMNGTVDSATSVPNRPQSVIQHASIVNREIRFRHGVSEPIRLTSWSPLLQVPGR